MNNRQLPLYLTLHDYRQTSQQTDRQTDRDSTAPSIYLVWGSSLPTKRNSALAGASCIRLRMIHMNWATEMSAGTRNLRLSMHATKLPGNLSTITCHVTTIYYRYYQCVLYADYNYIGLHINLLRYCQPGVSISDERL